MVIHNNCIILFYMYKIKKNLDIGKNVNPFQKNSWIKVINPSYNITFELYSFVKLKE